MQSSTIISISCFCCSPNYILLTIICTVFLRHRSTINPCYSTCTTIYFTFYKESECFIYLFVIHLLKVSKTVILLVAYTIEISKHVQIVLSTFGRFLITQYPFWIYFRNCTYLCKCVLSIDKKRNSLNNLDTDNFVRCCIFWDTVLVLSKLKK